MSRSASTVVSIVRLTCRGPRAVLVPGTNYLGLVSTGQPRPGSRTRPGPTALVGMYRRCPDTQRYL